MHPEVSNASLATQKLSIALSREWIKHAHDDLTAENRANVPIDVELAIDQWNGTTRDSSDEQALIQSLESHIEARKQSAIEQVKLMMKHWAALAGGIVFALLGFGAGFLFVFAAFCFLYFYLGNKNLQKRKDQVAYEFDQLLEHSKQVLRASLAELVDWRKEYAKEDGNASLVTNLLESISPEQYTFSSHDTARSVLS